MKKLISLFISCLIVISVFSVCISASAATTTEKSITIDKTGDTKTINPSFTVKGYNIKNNNVISFDKSKLKITSKAAGTTHLYVYNKATKGKSTKIIDYKVTTKVVTGAKDADTWHNVTLNGAAVWPVKDLPLYTTSSLKTKVGTLDAVVGNKMRKATIVDSDDGKIKVKGKKVVNGKAKDITGWASASTNFYVNMSEVNTNIKYNITNAYKSIFVVGDACDIFNTGVGTNLSGDKEDNYSYHYKPSTNTENINKCEDKSYNSNAQEKYKHSYSNLPNITGKRLYTYDDEGSKNGKVTSTKLDKQIFVVPILWKFAREVGFAECVAERNGYNLKIYDSYRPQNVCDKFWNAGEKAAASGAGKSLVTRTVAGKTWSLGWFIADPNGYGGKNYSDHARGVAVDLTMQYKGTDDEISTQSNMHDLSCNSIKGVASSWNTDKTNVLHKIMVTGNDKKSTLTPLASEWWHFNINNSSNYTKTDHNVDW